MTSMGELNVTGLNNGGTTATIAVLHHTTMITDDDDDLSDGMDSSSPESPFDDSDLLNSVTCSDDVTAQLAAAGPIGIAAAAAIATAKKRKRPHSFETNPSIRKRQQTRLLRKLKATIDEYTTRVGQQAVVLICTPGKPQNSYKVFGAKPLEDVVKNCKTTIMSELEQALAVQAPPPPLEDPTLHELPPLVIDGIPTPVEKMTQAQLRAFIPLMLKYATGRGKPGWGKEQTRPVWWPNDLPWANVRSDVRTEEEKQRVSWTHALRQIVINCYKFHGRDDLLPAFSDDDDHKEKVTSSSTSGHHHGGHHHHHHHHSTHHQNAANAANNNANVVKSLQLAQYPTVVQTIHNPDGTVSIFQVDPTNALVTLPDGTQAQVQAISAIQAAALDPNQTLTEVTGQGLTITNNGTEEDVKPSNIIVATAEATINQDGQIIFTTTGEDGTSQAFPVSGMVTIPVSMYPTMVTSIAQLAGAQGNGQAGLTQAYVVNASEWKAKSEGAASSCTTSSKSSPEPSVPSPARAQITTKNER